MKKIFILLTIIVFNQLSFGQKALHLYGGESHDFYLGCLNCDDINSNSIWNDIGKYGSNINSTSIWNDIGTYGSDISNYSPWNDLARYPPAIVDKEGNFYGYLTTNEINPKRADFSLVLTMYKYHDMIKEDVSKWYDKLFR